MAEPSAPPINLARAVIPVEVDLSAYEEAKRRIESDLDGLKRKIAETLDVAPLLEEMEQRVARIGESLREVQRDQQVQSSPAPQDQRNIDTQLSLLVDRAASIDATLDRIESTVEDIANAPALRGT